MPPPKTALLCVLELPLLPLLELRLHLLLVLRLLLLLELPPLELCYLLSFSRAPTVAAPMHSEGKVQTGRSWGVGHGGSSEGSKTAQLCPSSCCYPPSHPGRSFCSRTSPLSYSSFDLARGRL
ncbi:uncharacterized protein LOC123439954 [Hordeum vulgare subsp. vulgare]|uniref:Predicted protein n=1 Tax=Hordeum vulgare subsp. vulgare TaxID=112509 RepID=F2E8K9_HORVV|nr:uncharacterized protein LOC123439954 [Hordeum vulgare subsp. vulgare]BAK03681.1 predicted protein [Hordeum vulgare subsp. vulgare]